MASNKQIGVLVKAGYSREEVADLVVGDASALIDQVKSNRWRRLTAAQIEARQAKEVAAESKAMQAAVLEPHVVDKAMDELFKDLSRSEQEEEQDRRSGLRLVASEAKCVAEKLGCVLVGYKKLCGHGKWLKFLTIIGIPERMAQKYMALAAATMKLTPSMRKALESNGVQFSTKITAINRRIASKAAEMAESRLQQMPNPNLGSDFDFGPSLSQEEEAEIAKEVVAAVRPSKPTPTRTASASSIPGSPIPALPVSPEGGVTVWKNEVRGTLQSLKGVVGNDERFRDIVLDLLDELAPINARKEVAYAG
jgi:hypothetical protein